MVEKRMAVVFVNFHSEQLIVPKVSQLSEEGFLIAVRDNSGGYPRDMADYVVAGSNIGFGAGCNRAALSLQRQVDVFCFHNPDVEATATTLRSLEQAVRAQQRPGIVAPSERVGSRVRTIGYHYPTSAREFLLSLRTVSRLGGSGRIASDGGRGRGPGLPLGVRGRRFPSGALLVVAREAFEAVRGFDERYFLYAEDLDLCHRVQSSGREVSIQPDLVADHLWGRSSPLDGARREILRWLGVELFAELHGKSWRAMRAAHRVVLPTIGRHCAPLAAEVGVLWKGRCKPSETLGSLRPQLVSGALLRAPAPE